MQGKFRFQSSEINSFLGFRLLLKARSEHLTRRGPRDSQRNTTRTKGRLKPDYNDSKTRLELFQRSREERQLSPLPQGLFGLSLPNISHQVLTKGLTITFFVEIMTFRGFPVGHFFSSNLHVSLPEAMEWCTSPGKSLASLFEDKASCDVTFLVADKEYRAHRLIFAAHSPVFKAMFYGNFAGHVAVGNFFLTLRREQARGQQAVPSHC